MWRLNKAETGRLTVCDALFQVCHVAAQYGHTALLYHLSVSFASLSLLCLFTIFPRHFAPFPELLETLKYERNLKKSET
jgi:hypothetical protein